MKLPQKSYLVERVMPNATEEEKAEATYVWFSFLERLYRIAERRSAEAADSREPQIDDRVPGIADNV